MVASRDIEAGELVFKEEPLAFGPNHTALPCCLDCMKSLGKEDTYVCPECGLPGLQLTNAFCKHYLLPPFI